MGLTQQQLNAGIDALAALDPNFARALGNAGYPEPRIRAPGYTTLLRTIVGQQVSVAAATSIWNKLEAQFGDRLPRRNRRGGRFRHAARLRPVGPETGLCQKPRAADPRRRTRNSTPCPPTTRKRSRCSPRSRASAAGRPKSICCSPKAAPTSGPRATWRCRKRWAASSNSKHGRAKRRCANSPNPGARIAARRRSSAGIVTIWR